MSLRPSTRGSAPSPVGECHSSTNASSTKPMGSAQVAAQNLKLLGGYLHEYFFFELAG